jgi:hypothetical protein
VQVSIRDWDGQSLLFHSAATTVAGSNSLREPTSLKEVLQSWGNNSLWLSLQTDKENEEWIFCGLVRGLLIIGHDGSYMPCLANNICSCAVVLHCMDTGYYADLTWVERSSKARADNYRAEIFGGVGAQLLVKAAVTGRHVAGSHIPHYGCDNMGIVIHGNHCRRPMLEKQAQADILRLFKSLMSTSCIGSKMNVGGNRSNLFRHANSSFAHASVDRAQRPNWWLGSNCFLLGSFYYYSSLSK